MEATLRTELDSCTEELRSISDDLEDISRELQSAVFGMSLFRYTWTLEDCARRYRSAATRLSNIR